MLSGFFPSSQNIQPRPFDVLGPQHPIGKPAASCGAGAYLAGQHPEPGRKFSRVANTRSAIGDFNLHSRDVLVL